MANVSYDLMWREAMAELLDLLETEHPEDPSLTPKELGEWACVYIKYLQIMRKLEEAYDQMVHPQKSIDIRKVLEATVGRILEIRHWMVKLNDGVDHIHMEDILMDMKMGPEALEVPVPRYFVEDRNPDRQDTGERDRFLEALMEKYLGTGAIKEIKTPNYIDQLAPLPQEIALRVLQVNERGRQGRIRASTLKSHKSFKALEERRAKSGKALTVEEAAVKIQCQVRRFLARCRVRRMREDELLFLGMMPKPAADREKDPSYAEARNKLRRKVLQKENRTEYEEALVVLKRRIHELEGQDMRETIQDKINQWFIEGRNPETGEYPAFPDEEDGGSKTILNPPPPELEAEAADAKAKGKGKDAKGKGGKDAGKGGKKDDKKGGKSAGDEAPVEEKIGDAFVPLIEQSVQQYVRLWQDKDESSNFYQKYDPEMVKDELRPLVFEEVRTEVDKEMRVLLENLREMVEAERAAKLGKKRKKGKKKAKKKGKKEKGKKGKKDLDKVPPDTLFIDLAAAGIARQCSRVHVQDYLGLANVLSYSAGQPPPPQPGGAAGGAADKGEPSMAQSRQLVTEYCVLPLGSRLVSQQAPLIKTVLLYGPKGSGKTMLSNSIANLTGSTWFDLSPRNTDGKYSGSKSSSTMVQTVFKLAKLYAPSVVYIDEVEKVFLTDKKKIKEFGFTEAPNRIKKDLLKAVKGLTPGDRVLVVGNTSEPWLCVKKDAKALIAFWNKYLYLPVPDDASRKHLWSRLFARHGTTLPFHFPLSALSRISDGLSSGQIDCIVRHVLTERRKETVPSQSVEMNEILHWVCKVKRYKEAELQQYRDWTLLLPGRTKKEEKKDDGKGKGKGKKK